MSSKFVLPLVLLCGTFAFSQNADDPTGMFFSSSPGEGCPVEVKAKLDVPAKLVPVEGGKQGESARHLHLSLNNSQPFAIMSAEFAVYGYPKGLRFAPTVLRDPDPDLIRKVFPISQRVSPGTKAALDFRLENMSGVAYIDINSMTYADGSKWQSDKRHSCRATGSSSMDASMPRTH